MVLSLDVTTATTLLREAEGRHGEYEAAARVADYRTKRMSASQLPTPAAFTWPQQLARAKF
jgi:hypothetical protein